MSFIWPILLWSLLAIPIFIWLYFRMQKRRKQYAERYGSLGLARQQSTGREAGSRRHVPAILFLAGLIILFLALARPQMVLGLPKLDGVVILAFDVSGSMSATDFKPTRLEAAKAIAKDFVQHQPTTIRIGIVAFSDSGFSTQLPTNDQASIRTAIDRLHIQRGTSLANGIVVSLNTIANVTGQAPIISAAGSDSASPTPAPLPAKIDNSAVIVLLTDGENNMDPDPMRAAKLAADRGVRIHTIAIGSLEGMNLTVNGFTVHTQLDEAALQQISKLTKGFYFNAKTEGDLRSIYDSLEPGFTINKDETEVTSIFAGISILMLLIGGILSLLWFNHFP